MPKYTVDLWLDGYETDVEREKAGMEFIEESLDFSASSVSVKLLDDSMCIWKLMNDLNDLNEYWDTSCEHSHLFFNGSPESNEYTFCPYCGKLIQEEE